MLVGQAIPEVEDQNDLSPEEQSDSDSDQQDVQDDSSATVMVLRSKRHSKRQHTESLSG